MLRILVAIFCSFYVLVRTGGAQITVAAQKDTLHLQYGQDKFYYVDIVIKNKSPDSVLIPATHGYALAKELASVLEVGVEIEYKKRKIALPDMSTHPSRFRKVVKPHEQSSITTHLLGSYFKKRGNYKVRFCITIENQGMEKSFETKWVEFYVE